MYVWLYLTIHVQCMWNMYSTYVQCMYCMYCTIHTYVYTVYVHICTVVLYIRIYSVCTYVLYYTYVCIYSVCMYMYCSTIHMYSVCICSGCQILFQLSTCTLYETICKLQSCLYELHSTVLGMAGTPKCTVDILHQWTVWSIRRPCDLATQKFLESILKYICMYKSHITLKRHKETTHEERILQTMITKMHS